MLGDDEWDAITQDWAARINDSNGPAYRFLGGLLDLNSRLKELEEKVTEVLEREDIGRREAALKAARDIVGSLPSEQKNDRGYRDGAMRSPERLRMELEVARYLMGQEA